LTSLTMRLLCFLLYPPQWSNGSQWARASSLSRLHDRRHTTFGRTPLDKWSAQRRDLYRTTQISKENSQYQYASGRRPTP